MDTILNSEPWWRFGVALVIGAFIGLEREYFQQRGEFADFAGIRTFSLMGLAGAVAAFLADDHGIVFFFAVYALLGLLIVISHWGEVYHLEGAGITTEVAALLTPLLGAMVIWDYAEIAGALGVVTALVPSLKPRLQTVIRGMQPEDLRATLEFALVSAVILPLLPNEFVGPYELINPFQIWLLVVFVSGISFFGYVLMKAFGTNRGVGLAGLLGGLVSSTATTVTLAGRSKESPQLSPMLANAILLASSVMFPRVLAGVLIVHPPLLAYVAIPAGAMLLTGLLTVAYLWRRRVPESEVQQTLDLGNPLKLPTAISFGLLLAVVLIAVQVAQDVFGTGGVYGASVISGFVDVNAITLSASELAALNNVTERVAAVAIVLATLVNTGSKAMIAFTLGDPRLRKTLIPAFGLMIIAGAISGALLLLM